MFAVQRRLQTPVPETNHGRLEESRRHDAQQPKHAWQSIAVRPASFQGAPVIQSKLMVGSANDPLEREADRMASEVVGTVSSSLNGSELSPAGLSKAQRKCGQCEAEEDEKLRRKESGNSSSAGAAPPIVNETLSSPGTPLDPGTRGFMESRFGHDFSAVRVHSDLKAAESARAINAHAYTVGSDIVIGSGHQSAHTDAGRKLLAHELAHVVQQSAGLRRNVIQRWTINNCNLSQAVYVEDAFAESFDDLTKASSRMNQKPTTQRVKDAMWMAFRDDSEETIEKVRPNINTLKQKLTNTRITCRKSSDAACGTDAGYVSRGKDDYGEVYFCMPTFSDLPPAEQANVLTHECAHKYLGVKDTGYFAIGCKETAAKSGPPKDSGTAGDDPATRLNNADAYACFVAFLARLTKDDVKAKAAGFRGSDLTLQVSEPWLYTKTQTPSRSTFKMTGAPENSGFRFKWSLSAGGKEFPLTSARTKTTVTGYDVDALEVFVDNDVRRKLSELKISKATVKCDIRLYESSTAQAAPEITKSEDISVSDGEDPFDLSKAGLP